MHEDTPLNPHADQAEGRTRTGTPGNLARGRPEYDHPKDAAVENGVYEADAVRLTPNPQPMEGRPSEDF